MRRKAPRVGFADMPASLRDLPLDAPAALKEARNAWLSEHRLALVDYFGWLRAHRPRARRRPPSRRKLMTAEQLAEFDRQREEEEPWRW